jgi:putative transposase
MMAKARHSAAEIVQLVDRVERMIAGGATIGEAAKAVGAKYSTVYHWRLRFANLEAPAVERLRQLEAENARLRRCLLEFEEAQQMSQRRARPT